MAGGGGDAAPPTGGGGTPPLPAAGPELVLQLETGGDIQTVAAAGASVLDQFGRRPIWRIALQARADVRFAEPNALQEAPESTRNSVWFIGGDQGSYGSQWGPEALRLADAQAVAGTGTGVRVAVLDTGVELTHPLLAPRLARRGDGSVLGRDFVDDDADPSEAGSRSDLG